MTSCPHERISIAMDSAESTLSSTISTRATVDVMLDDGARVSTRSDRSASGRSGIRTTNSLPLPGAHRFHREDNHCVRCASGGTAVSTTRFVSFCFATLNPPQFVLLLPEKPSPARASDVEGSRKKRTLGPMRLPRSSYALTPGVDWMTKAPPRSGPKARGCGHARRKWNASRRVAEAQPSEKNVFLAKVFS